MKVRNVFLRRGWIRYNSIEKGEDDIREFILHKVHLGSFIKFTMVLFISLGLAVGTIGVLLSLFGQNVYFTVGSIQLKGIAAGLLNLLFAPIIFALMGGIIALLAYLPFKLWLTIFEVKLSGEFEDLADYTETKELP